MADIFLSYSSLDKERVKSLIKALEREGWSVWWDQRTRPGDTFDRMIDRELKSARCVIVVWSVNSIKSDWVREEATSGKSRNALFPVKIDNIDLPLGFSLIQAVNLIGWTGYSTNTEFRHLVESISEKIGRRIPAQSQKTITEEKKEPVQPAPPPVAPVQSKQKIEAPPVVVLQKEIPSKRNLLIGGLAIGLLFIAIIARSITSEDKTQQPPEVKPTPSSHNGPSTNNVVIQLPDRQQVQFEMVSLRGGKFRMGSDDGESDEKPIHQVTIAPFSIGKYEVTQAQWKSVMGNNPSTFKGDNLPVENVSWNDVKEFLKRLGNGYRLPTESEWEYAARGGSSTKWSYGDDESRLGDYAWFSGNSGNLTKPVGQKQPNPFGLFDMHGNVWEWCEDQYRNSYDGAPTDGSAWTGLAMATYRVVRGGGWINRAVGCRSAHRYAYAPGNRYDSLGFRLSRTLP
jgi:formylglycine-generating enzyme required for sulfatase activity